MGKTPIKQKTMHLFDRKKQLFVESMKKTYGNIAKSCDAVGVTRQTFKLWEHQCEEFNIAVNDVKELCKDSAEDCILTAIKNGDVVAAKYYLDRKARDRSYGEKNEIVHSSGNLDSLKDAIDEAVKSNEQEY